MSHQWKMPCGGGGDGETVDRRCKGGGRISQEPAVCSGNANISRRAFLRRSGWGLASGLTVLGLGTGGMHRIAGGTETARARVALMHGASRADNVYQALKHIEADIRAGLAGKKRVIIKPNMVVVDRQLAATHVECLEGILECIKAMHPGEIVVGESPASGAAAEGYDNYGYYRLEKSHGVKFVDLDTEPYALAHLIDARHRPAAVRYSKMLLDPDTYIISSAILKTHDRTVVTLGLKNLAVGGIIKDAGFRWGKRDAGTNDKPLVHGGRGNEGIHFNLFSLAKLRCPHLTVLDGFEAMEGNGPSAGTPVEHRVGVASADWLAADWAGVELMGFDFAKVGYLRFSAEAGLGAAGPEHVEVIGERIADHVRAYRPHDSIEAQYKWLEEPTA